MEDDKYEDIGVEDIPDDELEGYANWLLQQLEAALKWDSSSVSPEDMMHFRSALKSKSRKVLLRAIAEARRKLDPIRREYRDSCDCR